MALFMDQQQFIDPSGPWQFFMGAADNAGFSGETVPLPGTMDENRKGLDNRDKFTSQHLNRDYTYTGPAAYRREVSIPAAWAGRPIFLRLEWTKKTRVWVDGQPAGPQQNSYTARPDGAVPSGAHPYPHRRGGQLRRRDALRHVLHPVKPKDMTTPPDKTVLDRPARSCGR